VCFTTFLPACPLPSILNYWNINPADCHVLGAESLSNEENFSKTHFAPQLSGRNDQVAFPNQNKLSITLALHYLHISLLGLRQDLNPQSQNYEWCVVPLFHHSLPWPFFNMSWYQTCWVGSPRYRKLSKQEPLAMTGKVKRNQKWPNSLNQGWWGP
jgi:hypothetical protein